VRLTWCTQRQDVSNWRSSLAERPSRTFGLTDEYDEKIRNTFSRVIRYLFNTTKNHKRKKSISGTATARQRQGAVFYKRASPRRRRRRVSSGSNARRPRRPRCLMPTERPTQQRQHSQPADGGPTSVAIGASRCQTAPPSPHPSPVRRQSDRGGQLGQSRRVHAINCPLLAFVLRLPVATSVDR